MVVKVVADEAVVVTMKMVALIFGPPNKSWSLERITL